ncbi:pilus assembly protein TadG-related protein [Ancylobacter terrae]|uniref:pilus assembly protein TadG-related protein n=1 Tax=Ancylobacter sp. sgz301288 TaxID=3342077 RepID=UPI00385D527D
MTTPFHDFRSSRSGNVAILFGFAAIPLFAAAGLALDYTFAARERADLQNALDSAVISLAKMPVTTSAAEMKTRAQAFVNAQMPKPTIQNVNLTVATAKGQITLSASGDYPTTLSRVLNIVTGDASHNFMHIATTAQASWGNGKVEVALVLDNTGSMGSGNPTKISRLKTAAASLVDTLAAQAVEADTVKIGLVPFSISVRLPTSFSSASWMDKTGASPIAKEIFNNTANVNRFDLFTKLGTSWGGCVEMRPSPYDVTDPAPSSGTPGTLVVPFFAPDEPGESKDTSVYPNNYIADKTTATAFKEKQGNTAKYISTNKPFGTLNTSFGPNDGCGMKELMPLTTNFTTLKTAINSMVATGNTNIPLGLSWGWYMVSPNAMLNSTKPYSDDETAKVIVLLSDGKNELPGLSTNGNENKSYYSGIGYFWQGRLGTTSTSASTQNTAANNRLKELCKNINALKKPNGKRAIDVYTVLVEESDSATSTLMQNCASESGMYYNVADSADLLTVFNNIAGSIGKLHLSK